MVASAVPRDLGNHILGSEAPIGGTIEVAGTAPYYDDVATAIGNNEEQKENHSGRHKI
jgi:hypothetical protein